MLGWACPWPSKSGHALGRSPALRALVALLQLDMDDWPFDQLLAVLGSNFFQPQWPQWQEGRTAAAVEQAIRSLQIPRGRQQLIEQLRQATQSRDREPRPEARPLAAALCRPIWH